LDQARISDIIHSVTRILDNTFVPQFLGYNHITRENYINVHTSEFSKHLLGASEDTATVIMDGTYLYIQKSSNFELQKMTYSLHKFRNLVKPMMVISTTGYILAVEGLFFADNGNNDANILKSMLYEEGFDSFFFENDNLILDRGFRDCVSDIEERNFNVLMPSLLPKRSKQFTTLDGNNSRRVTMLRWLVESVNGRIKNVFKFFDSTIPITYLPLLGSLFRISCALSNACSPALFTDSAESLSLVQTTLDKMPGLNRLQEYIEEEGLEHKRTCWRTATQESVIDFPRITDDDMKIITLGVYQTTLASSYTALHMDENSTYGIYYHIEERHLLRAKIESRYTKGRSHQLWIKYDSNLQGHKGITGYYCTCKVGARVVGCCAHIASVIWFFGCGRHEKHLKLPTKALAESIKDADQIIR